MTGGDQVTNLVRAHVIVGGSWDLTLHRPAKGGGCHPQLPTCPPNARKNPTGVTDGTSGSALA